MILKEVVETVEKYNMIGRGEHIVVGVSGGADSVALLSILCGLREKWGITLTVAHLDHMIRGEESKKEAKFVKTLAGKMGISCISGQSDVLSIRKEKGLCLQESARHARYCFYQEVLNKVSADKIALGHHADDQAETILMRLIRGSSIKGLSGIPPFRNNVFIRPLIDVTRKSIEAYLRAGNIAYVSDSSQHEPHYLRNKIRHNLIPLLQKEFNPKIVQTLIRTADLLRSDNKMLEKTVDDAAAKLIVKRSDEIFCPIHLIKEYPPPLYGRLIRKIISVLKGSNRGLSFKHVVSVCHLLDGNGPSSVVHLPDGLRVWRQYGNLVFTMDDAEKPLYCYSFSSIPDSVRINETGKKIFFSVEKIEINNNTFLNKNDNIQYFNFDAVRFPLVIRNCLRGDRFYPLGLGGRKKLKDFFIDKKVPVRQRHNIPLILFDDRIAWVCGFRIDERFKVKHNADRVLKVWVE